jgi:N-acetylglucosaminyldiphosphoundecaprenol N-acetyl-beta-D-mannosaminyltransferase
MADKVILFDIEFNNFSTEETISMVEGLLERNKVNGRFDYIVTPNVDHVVNFHKNSRFRQAYEKAVFKLVDGAPILFYSKVVRNPLKEKLSGSDLTPLIFKLANERKYRVFIFGSLSGVPERAIKNLKDNYNYNFPISFYSPPFGFENSKELLQASIQKINEFEPDILLVSLGSPKGEIFLYENSENIKAALALQIGASIDFIAGRIKRAPKWMQRIGLEWFYRFLKEPKRLFKRYFINDSYFIVLIIKDLFKRIFKRGF